METLAIAAARASRWAAMLACSLGLAVPCAAVPFAADSSGPPDLQVSVVVAADAAIPASEPFVPIDPLIAAGSNNSPSAPLLADASALPVRAVVPAERARDRPEDHRRRRRA